MFGNYYVFDALYPVAPLLQEQLGFTDQQIGLLDTAYNVAALLTLIAGGVLIDRLGTARSAVLFARDRRRRERAHRAAAGAVPGSPAIAMAAGRFVLGVGSELFIVAATTVVGRWFKGKEISFALAVQLLIARLGSLGRGQVAGPREARSSPSWQPPLLVAAGLGVLWLVFAVVYAALERPAARRYGVARAGATDKLVLADLVRFGRAYWWS